MKLLFLNVYLPTECLENYDQYLCYLGKIVSILSEPDVDAICILGDFNASPYSVSSLFFRELQNLCHEHDLVIADIASLPAGSYTHINNGSNSCSWLDHVIISKNINK